MVFQVGVLMSISSGPVVCSVAAVYSLVYPVAPAVPIAAVFWYFWLDHLQYAYTNWRLPLGHFGFPFWAFISYYRLLGPVRVLVRSFACGHARRLVVSLCFMSLRRYFGWRG